MPCKIGDEMSINEHKYDETSIWLWIDEWFEAQKKRVGKM